MSTKINKLLDELVDAVQDFDSYCGRTNGKVDSSKMKQYKKARQEIKRYVKELKLAKKIKDLNENKTFSS
jgi:IS4 transposase